eukprot:GGOE01020466.1.p1 GENE.GGOE01020466.1~~GGOE01020466.1.p1  ORF type:complete len:680 (-),score=176.64 GGOE01020466.1:177-2192(-)
MDDQPSSKADVDEAHCSPHPQATQIIPNLEDTLNLGDAERRPDSGQIVDVDARVDVVGGSLGEQLPHVEVATQQLPTLPDLFLSTNSDQFHPVVPDAPDESISNISPASGNLAASVAEDNVTTEQANVPPTISSPLSEGIMVMPSDLPSVKREIEELDTDIASPPKRARRDSMGHSSELKEEQVPVKLEVKEEQWEVKSEESVRTEDFFSDAEALELLEGEELFGEEELAIVAEAEAEAATADLPPIVIPKYDELQDDDFSVFARRAVGSPLWCIIWSHDATKLYAGTEEGRILVLDGRPSDKFLQELSVLEGHSMAVVSLALNPSGTVLASSSLDCTILLWTVRRSHVACRKIDTAPLDFWTVAFHPSGNTLATGTASGALQLYDIHTLAAKQVPCLPPKEKVLGTAAAFSPDGRLMGAAFRNGVVALVDTTTYENVRLIRRHAAAVRSLAFLRDASLVLAATDDAVVHIYDTATTSLLRSLRGHTASLTGMAVSPNGLFVATCASDLRVKVYDTETWKCWRTWGPPYHVEWTALLVNQHFGCREQERIVRWKMYGERKRIALDTGPNPLSNNHLVAYLRSNVTTCPPPKREIHEAAVTCLAFARDGRLCSVGDDGAVVAYTTAPYSLTLPDLTALNSLMQWLEEKGQVERRQRQDAKLNEFNLARAEFT